MQNTSDLYKEILNDTHFFETKVVIDGNEVSGEEVLNLNVDKEGMAKNMPSVGGALSATLDLTIKEPDFTVPKMGEIQLFVRACRLTSPGTEPILSNGILSFSKGVSLVDDILVFSEDSGVYIEDDIIYFDNSPRQIERSEWINCGTFYIDTRETSKSVNARSTVRFTAFDTMMKAEQDYPNTNHNWPYKDSLVVAEIAQAIGVEVDSRTYDFITTGYMVDLPLGYTMRETLEHIAASYCGNFVITAEGKLLFVPLWGLEDNPTGSFLADENGNALMFGDERWYILV